MYAIGSTSAKSSAANSGRFSAAASMRPASSSEHRSCWPPMPGPVTRRSPGASAWAARPRTGPSDASWKAIWKSIATLHSGTQSLLPKAIVGVRSAYQSVTIDIQQASASRSYDLLRAGAVDFAVVLEPPPSYGLLSFRERHCHDYFFYLTTTRYCLKRKSTLQRSRGTRWYSQMFLRPNGM